MAGRGPAPKPLHRRAHQAKDAIPTRVVELTPASPQRLPNDLLEPGEVWHPATKRWWKRWCESPLSATWTTVDWSEFEACAVLHHQYMRKRTFTLASELRLRMAKFGATPEDRARLRIIDADADRRESERPAPQSSRERYVGLRPVPPRAAGEG
jgi:hypothetical protein